jgi:hypothetical protein
VIEALLWLARPLPISTEPWTVNVCSGQAMTIENLARRLLILAGRDPESWEFRRPETVVTADACVGDPSRLASLGLRLKPPADQDFLDLLQWIRETEPAPRQV